ncbi:MAG: hypothetical protein ACYTGX_18395, partial [Planctomycetota bacterium]
RISIDGGDGAAFTAERRVTLAADDPTAPAGAAGAATGPVDASVPAGGRGPLVVQIDGSPAAALMTAAEQPDSESTDRVTVAAELWTAAEAYLAAGAGNAEDLPAAAQARVTALRDIATRRLYRLLALRAKSLRRGESNWRNGVEARNRASDPEAVALTLAALARAKAAGLPVPAKRLAGAAAALDDHFTDATDDDAKAWLLFCRSFHEAPAYAWVNRLYRARATLGTRSLALLAHTLATGERTAEAKQVLAALEAKAAGAAGARHWTASAPAGRIGEEDATITALAVAAAREAKHESAVVAEAGRWLAAARRGAGWRAPLAGVIGLRGATGNAPPARVTVEVAGRPAGTVALGSPWASGRVVVPAEQLGEGAVAVRLVPAGAGAFRWSAARDAARPDADGAPSGLMVARLRTRTAGRIDGHRLVAGRSIDSRRHRLDVDAVAKRLVPGWDTRTDVTVVWGSAPLGRYWIYEPLPAGAVLLTDSFDQADDVRRDAGGVWVRLVRGSTEVSSRRFSYRLRGEWPGTYVAGPARVARSPYAAAWPLTVSVNAGAEVAAAGADPTEGSVLSTYERLAAGRTALARKDYAAARSYLLPLADGRLSQREFKQVTPELLEACAGAKAGEDVVRFFEVLRERDPNFVISFDRTVDVGEAYAGMGEHERSRQIYAAVADALFLQEAGAVGALEQLGDVVRTTMFAYAQRAFFVGRKAPATRAAAGEGYTRDDLFGIAVGALRRYLADYGTAEAADEVSLTLATAQMEAGDFTAARATAADSAARHPASRFLDTFDYIQAAAAFALRDFDAALALCRRLITHDYGVHANP